MTIVTTYDHTRSLFLSGQLNTADDYRINLYTVLPVNATATTKATAESGATQVATANGYTQDTQALANVAVTIVATTDGRFDADDVTWTASGGSIVADFAMVWNNTSDLPLFRLDFEGTVTATDGVPFVVQWDASGIYTLS